VAHECVLHDAPLWRRGQHLRWSGDWGRLRPGGRVIGAGAVVIREVPANLMAVSIPGRDSQVASRRLAPADNVSGRQGVSSMKDGRPQGEPTQARTGKRKVLFVANVARHLLAFHLPFMRLFQQRGWEVHAACNPAAEQQDLEAHGVKVQALDLHRNIWHPQNLVALWQLYRLLKGQDYRLVHVHTPLAACLGRVAARLAAARPVLYTAHGFHFFKGASVLSWLAYYPVEWLCARWTDELLVMNEEDLARARRLPVRGRVRLVPGVGVPMPELAQLDDSDSVDSVLLEESLRKAIDKAPAVALVAGELSPTKNVGLVLRAWRIVAHEIPGAVLLIAGDGSQKGALQVLARKLVVQDSVRFLGFRRDVWKLMVLADVVVSASRREGLPRVVMEAMAAARPVVATNVRGNRDLVVDGVTGLLVPQRDHRQMAAALIAVLTNPQFRKSAGEAGRRRVKPYALKQVLPIMEDIYSKWTES